MTRARLSHPRRGCRRSFAGFEDDPACFTHNDARVRAGYDPIMALFLGGGCRFTLRGRAGDVLLAPTPTVGSIPAGSAD